MSSWYPSGCNPYTYQANAVAPPSPVPSHQSSSQSGATSYDAHSISTFEDYSVSTTTASQAPSWATPLTPRSDYYSTGSVPTSPSGSSSTYTGSSVLVPIAPTQVDTGYTGEQGHAFQRFKTTRDTSREQNAVHRANKLLNETAETATDCASTIKHSRERRSQMQALSLLSETAETSVNPVIPNQHLVASFQLNEKRGMENDEAPKEKEKNTMEELIQHGREMRAMALLEATAGKDVGLPAGVSRMSKSTRKESYQYTNDETEKVVKEKSNRIDDFIQNGTKMRALALLEATAGQDVKSGGRVTSDSVTSRVLKPRRNSLGEAAQSGKGGVNTMDDFIRHGTNMRALSLLDDTVGQDVRAMNAMQSNVARGGGLNKDNLHEQAIQRMKSGSKGTHFRVAKESLAHSSRSKTSVSEDARDPETIAGMKCQIDIERERKAQKKALQIMRYGCIA